MSGELVECGQHDYLYEPGDTCPVCEGAKAELERIIKLLEDRVAEARSTIDMNGQVTAMRVPVELEALEAITQAIIYAIKGEQK